MEPVSTRKQLEADLTELKRMVLRLGKMAEESISKAIWALKNQDAELARTVLAKDDDIDDLAGLMHKSPVHAVLMLIFMLSLAGIPPTAGFIGKYYIFLALIETGNNGMHHLMIELHPALPPPPSAGEICREERRRDPQPDPGQADR